MPRGNPKTLVVPTSEQARINGLKGKIASDESKARRKTLREELLALLSDGDTQSRVSLALIGEATNGNASGSVARAFETIRDTIGEKPTDKTEATIEAGDNTLAALSKISLDEKLKAIEELTKK